MAFRIQLLLTYIALSLYHVNAIPKEVSMRGVFINFISTSFSNYDLWAFHGKIVELKPIQIM
jgi:hypothetical protein